MWTVAAEQSPHAPTRSLSLRPYGFSGVSLVKRLSEDSHFTLDYLDSRHLLVTFAKPGLVKRLADCPPAHDDRVMQAVVLDAATGKAVSSAEWYVHDRRQYLWSLGGRRFLLRTGRKLFKLDAGLNQSPFWESSEELRWVSVTPDGKQIVVESSFQQPAGRPGGSKAKQKTDAHQIRFLDVQTAAVQRTVNIGEAVTLKALSSGYLDLVRSKIKPVWLVRFGPEASKRANITRVTTLCVPDLLHPSSNTILVGRCSKDNKGYMVSAFTVAGHRLWRERRGERVIPALASSEDGVRFAIGALRTPLNWQPSADGATEGATQQERWEQVIDVVETATGRVLLTLTTAPVMLIGRNYAMSPDSSQLAILRDTSIEIHGLPPVTQEERAKYIALQSDVPGVYVTPESDDDAAQIASAAAEELSAAAGAVGISSGQTASGAQSPGTGQMPANETQPTALATLKSNVLAVTVDVVVTDSHGQPVRGLQSREFSITEEGISQKVRYFDEHDPNRVPENPAPAAVAKRAPNVVTNMWPKASERAVTVILYDALNTPPTDQPNARQKLVQYLKSKPGELRVALFSLSRELRMLSGFTVDAEALLSVVDGKNSRIGIAGPLFGEQFNQSGDSLAAGELARGRKEGSDGVVTRQRESEAEQRSSIMDMRVAMTIEGLSQLARYLSGIPGRKNIVWLSGSFPLGLSPDLNLKNSFTGTRSYEEQVRKATELLTRAHAAVYPVDVRGLRTLFAYSVDAPESLSQQYLKLSQGYASGSLSSDGTGGPDNEDAFDQQTEDPSQSDARSLANEYASKSNLASQVEAQNRAATMAAEFATMNRIADETGGRAIYDTNDIQGAIRKSVEQGSHYYTLSYTPADRKFDGGFRRLRVTVPGKKYRLLYRKGYYAEDPNAPSRAMNVASAFGGGAMLQGTPEAMQIPFVARVVPLGAPSEAAGTAKVVSVSKQPAASASGKVQRYAIDYAVSMPHLHFAPATDGKYKGKIDLIVAAFNQQGQRIAGFSSTVSGELGPERYAQMLTAGFRMHQEVEIPIEAKSLRLGVQDGFTSDLGTAEIALPIPVPPEMPRRAGRYMPEIEPE